MANEDTNHNQGESKTDESRMTLAMHAIAEIISLADMLKREADYEGFDSILRGSLLRVKDLGSVVLSVVGGDDGREIAEMDEVVFGKPA